MSRLYGIRCDIDPGGSQSITWKNHLADSEANEALHEVLAYHEEDERATLAIGDWLARFSGTNADSGDPAPRRAFVPALPCGAVGGDGAAGDNASVHGVPKRFLDHHHCLSAWVAGASATDTPESNASFGVVFHSPSWGSAREEGNRLPREYIWYGDWPRSERPFTQYDERRRQSITMHARSKPPTKREPFPGTVLAAEWFAIFVAVRLAARAQPQVHPDAIIPFEPPLDPFVLYTTRREIADVIDGRLPISDTPWLSRLQRTAVGDLRRNIQRRKGRDYFIEPRYGSGFDTFVALIRPSENRRALRIAKDALAREEVEGVLTLDNLVGAYDATREWKLRKAERR